MTTTNEPPPSPEAAALGAAIALEQALQDLCRATHRRPSMTPAEVDLVLSYVAGAVAALPQACNQLGEILQIAASDQVLEMDSMSDTDDPTLAIDTARLQLENISSTAQNLYQLIDAVRTQTAHVISHARLGD